MDCHVDLDVVEDVWMRVLYVILSWVVNVLGLHSINQPLS